MADLLGSQYVQRAIEQHALSRVCFPALAACSTYFLDGEQWNDEAVACAAQFVAREELQLLVMCQARTKKERCRDDHERLVAAVRTRVVAYRSALRLSEGEQKARRHCGFLDLTDLGGPAAFYQWFCCMGPLAAPEETAAAIECRAKGGACELQLARLTKRVLESNYRFLAVLLHERDDVAPELKQ
jgi:hypothetical protein